MRNIFTACNFHDRRRVRKMRRSPLHEVIESRRLTVRSFPPTQDASSVVVTRNQKEIRTREAEWGCSAHEFLCFYLSSFQLNSILYPSRAFWSQCWCCILPLKWNNLCDLTPGICQRHVDHLILSSIKLKRSQMSVIIPKLCPQKCSV